MMFQFLESVFSHNFDFPHHLLAMKIIGSYAVDYIQHHKQSFLSIILIKKRRRISKECSANFPTARLCSSFLLPSFTCKTNIASSFSVQLLYGVRVRLTEVGEKFIKRLVCQFNCFIHCLLNTLKIFQFLKRRSPRSQFFLQIRQLPN